MFFYNRISHSTYLTSWQTLNLDQLRVNSVNYGVSLPLQEAQFRELSSSSPALQGCTGRAVSSLVLSTWCHHCLHLSISVDLIVLKTWVLASLRKLSTGLLSSLTSQTFLRVAHQHLTILFPTEVLSSISSREFLSCKAGRNLA